MKIKERPTHSPAGFLRKMQMSKHRVWILVEGIFDVPFYGQLCDNNKFLRKEIYTIALAKELPNFSGDGKQNLLSIYRYLNRRKALKNTLEGKEAIVLFIIDKDIDDIERTKVRSSHVLYTEYHSLENYLFRFGNLSSALSSAACLDVRLVRKRVGKESFAWTQKAAENWNLWVEYCLLVRKLKIENAKNYGETKSLMHSGAYSQCNEMKRKHLLRKAMRDSGLTDSKFNIAFKRVKKYVCRLYSQGNHDIIFKGEWYTKFLVQDAREIAGSRQYNSRRLEKRLLPCLLATLDYNGSWADYFHHAIEQLIKTV